MNRDGASDPVLEAVAALRRGEVIGLPTETVYGLAADASNPEAVKKIFALKGRPADHPLIVHIADADSLSRWTSGASMLAEKLAQTFWPGPLTMILPRHPSVSDAVTGGQATVGLRCPAHPLALQVLRAFADGLAAPSANRFGRISPTTAAHVREEFGAEVPLILDGGDCEIGIESTIIDLSSAIPRILRPGKIGHGQIEAIIGPVAQESNDHSPRASGTLAAHYAPRTPMLMLPRAGLAKEAEEQRAFGKRVAILAIDALPHGEAGLVLSDDAQAFAHGLYAALRRLDARGENLLLVERPPEGEAWMAVHDRLRRAVAGAGPNDDAP
jgi:L-threonylcarbamoyladenylate synthase